MKKIYLLSTVTIINLAAFIYEPVMAQKATPANRTLLTNAEKAFVQDAINKNNEAMALAQVALQKSQKKDIQLIARQFMSDHRAAQKKLYAIANLTDTIPYSRYFQQPIVGTGKLPATDNLDNRRNRTFASISTDATRPATPPPAPAGNTSGNTVAGTGNNLQRIPGFDTSSQFGVNQTFNGNTSIDNANGINNSNRTDLASASGRASDNNTILGQNPGVNNQQGSNTIINSNNTNTGTINNSTDLPNTPNFPNRVIDTVRQTGSTTGFQNPGTNLSFPGNERYSKTTPATTPNNNAGSDYGVPGVVVNNAQTNTLNTAPYTNNDINSNAVQTGRVLPTSNPTSVINSSTTSMNNKDVGFNNANTNTGGSIQQSGQLAADNANGINRRTSEVINTPGNANSTSANIGNSTNNNVTNTTTTNTNGGAVLAGRTRNNRSNNNGTSQNNTHLANGVSNNTPSTDFYTNPLAANQSVNALQNVQPNTFDTQWAIQMNNNQQATATAYQAALRRVTNVQLKNYINTVLPLLHGHQFALKQWQATQ